MARSIDAIRWAHDDDGVVTLVFDEPTQSANVMSTQLWRSLAWAVDRLEQEGDRVSGVVLASAKRTFFAGGDLRRLIQFEPADRVALATEVRDGKRLLRRLETLGKPVVAAINGAALGGGLEICLAAHHRIIVDDARAVVGFPEVTLGLLPGAGGIVRSVRLLGVEAALRTVLLDGRRLPPQAALEPGLVDELVDSVDELIPAAKRWIKAANDSGESIQPWDTAGYEIPGGTPSQRALEARLPTMSANLRSRLKGANYPAPIAIMSAAVEGAQVDFDSASEIEGRYFVDLATGQVAKNMIQAFFFDRQQASGRRGRPATEPPFQVDKVAVLGAGMMGAAIAYVSANAGIEVVLKDVSQDAADRGKRHSQNLVEKAVSSGRSTKEAADALLARITPTEAVAAVQGADLVIEAVYEDPAVKAHALAELEPYVAEHSIVASNTSTLPITDLAISVSRPGDFIGLHFFSPVDKMPLLEIVRGQQTSEDTLHRALDFARQIGKTPIVVHDQRGFFTSRVITAFINEGVAMLLDGVPAPSIEQASGQAGYPAPVLQLTDELNLELAQRIGALNAASDVTWGDPRAYAVFDSMIAAGRLGRARGSGFYDYRDGRRERLWSGLAEMFQPTPNPAELEVVELAERLLFSESLEAVRCLEEGVIDSVADGNIGSILGIGFPGWTGGVFQFINGYTGGLMGFVGRADELAAKHGDRFAPPASLVDRARKGEVYRDEPAAAISA